MSQEIFELLSNAERDFRAGMAKLTNVRAMLAALDLPASSRAWCPQCGLNFKGESTLAVHAYQRHDGPVPAHWLEAEARAES